MTDLDNIPFDELEAAYLEKRRKKIVAASCEKTKNTV